MNQALEERLAVQRQLRAELIAAVARSVTSASGSGRTVSDPAAAAEYVANMLTVHRTDFLRELAAAFGEGA